MKIKRILIILVIAVLLIGILILFCTKNRQEVAYETGEIVPEEEISEEQERKTMVSIYFKDKQTGELTRETRMVDVKILANNPYQALIEMLLEGPKTESLEGTIPEGTKINGVGITGDMVFIDFTREFIDNHEGGLENESRTIYSIVNTLTELNEVNSVRILIDGKENCAFTDNAINFEQNFQRNN